MNEQGPTAIVTGAGTGIGRAVALALLGERLRASRSPAGAAEPLRRRPRDRRRRPRPAPCPTDVTDPASVDALFDATSTTLRPARPAVQQRRHRRRRRSARGADRRAVAGGGRRQPDRRLPLHPGGVPHDEGAGPAGRADHQQRLDLGPRAAAALRPLHGDQARDHRPDQVASRWTAARYDIACGQIDIGNAATEMTARMSEGVPAGRRLDRGRADDGRRATSPTPCSTWRACRSTPTSCS